MRTVAIVESDLRAARSEQDRLYWAFTRTARGKPVPAEITRRIVALERELAETRKADKPASA